MAKYRRVKIQICFWLVGAMLGGVASGAVVRSVYMPVAGEASVVVNWQLDSAPESCLIVQDTLPRGWRLQGAPVGSTEVAVRQDDAGLAFAIGTDEVPPSSGSVSYRLSSADAASLDGLAIEGQLQTIQEGQVCSWPIDSAGPNGIPGEGDLISVPAMTRLATIKSMSHRGHGGLELAFPESEPQDVVYVEYVPDMSNDREWRCIRACMPEERLDAPGIVKMDAPAPGFYRLRQ